LKIDEVFDREIVTLKNNLDFMTLHNNNKTTTKHNKIFHNNKNTATTDETKNQIEVDRDLFQSICVANSYHDFVLFDAGCVADIPFNECVDNWRMTQADGIFLVVSKKNFQFVNFNNIAQRLSEQKIDLLGIMVCKD
jgi:hypothetical protein